METLQIEREIWGPIQELPEREMLGPIRELPEEGLELRPFTLFIGKQGTGKSLVSQLVYFFRNLPFLIKYHEARLGLEVKEDEIVRVALDDLRSAKRSFVVFAGPSVRFEYRTSAGRPLAVIVNKLERRVSPDHSLAQEIKRVRGDKGPIRRRGHAIYIPAERVSYSHGMGPSVWQMFSFPSTLVLFADAMEEAGNTFGTFHVPDGKPDTEEGRWVWDKGRQALAGEVFRYRGAWRWKISEAMWIDVDMASSGQKANWPLILLAEVLFTWRKEGLIESPFYLHVEEPEIHLHPDAQVAMVKILAYLVNRGFRVLITTHSLTVLYAVNNLLVASDLPDSLDELAIPEPEVRLKRGDVGAYLFREDGIVESLVDRETGLLSEAHLAEVDERLGIELNRLEYLRAYGK
jgi:hypothetical protein